MEIKEEEVINRNSPFNFHTCDLCIFRTKSLRVILSHIKKHQESPKLDGFSCETANLELFECQFCYFEHGLKIVLDRHVSLVHGEARHLDPEIKLKGYICDKCDFETYSLLVFVRHVCDDSQLCASTENKINSKHCVEKSVSLSWGECEQRNVKARYKRGLKNHVSLKHIDKPFKFGKSSCKTKSDQFSKKYIERKCKDLNKIKWFECEQCSFKTKWKICLKKHTLFKHASPKEVKWFECESCSFKTKHPRSLTQHTLIKHSNPNEVKWFECKHCSYKTKWKGHLTQHTLLKHSNPDEVKWFECEHCSFKTKLKSRLKRHTLWKHSNPNDVQWLECEHCFYKTKEKGNLKRHTLNKHTSPNEVKSRVKWFECEKCSYKTKDKDYLTKHTLLGHSVQSIKEKYFECGHCFYKFRLKHFRKPHFIKASESEREMYRM